MDEPLLRVPEVARRLGIHGTEVYTLIEEGKLHAGKRGGLVYVPESALREYQDRQAQASR